MSKLTKARKRFSLEVNSHSLSYFQQCEMRYNFSEKELLTYLKEPYPFKRGSAISKYLALWYLARKREYVNDKLIAFENRLMRRMARDQAFTHSDGTDDTMHIATRLKGYFNKYRSEPYKVIAVEQGFSKILFEDENVKFIYSGRPDLVVDFGNGAGIGPIDHKSESQKRDLREFQNQFIGYCWGLGVNTGMINYIGLQPRPKNTREEMLEVLRRSAFTFSNDQIRRWLEDTTAWCHRIMRAIVNQKYLRSWNCDGMYSRCLYYSICSSRNPAEELINIKTNYERNLEPYRSW